MKYVIWKDETGEWRFRLLADNGKIICTGESYKNKKDCLKTVNLIKSSSEAEIEFM